MKQMCIDWAESYEAYIHAFSGFYTEYNLLINLNLVELKYEGLNSL